MKSLRKPPIPMCVWVCVRARFCFTYEDTNLYNDMGMT